MTAQPDPALDIAPTGLIRSTPPAPGEPPASPPARRALLPSMLVAALTLFATYGGLIAILMETSTPPGALVEPVRRTLLALGQGIRVYTVQPLSEHVEWSYSGIRWQTSVLTAFGLLALVLAAVGLYGVISYRVALRTREIGVRMALGAGRRNVFREVVGQGLSIALIGVVIGEVLTIMVGRVLGALDPDIQPPGLVVLVVTGLIWIVVSILATYVPAARASGVNPLIALRYE